MNNKISNEEPKRGFVYVEVLINGKHEALSVGSHIVGGSWVGMGITRKQFAVPIAKLEEAISAAKAKDSDREAA